MRFVEEGVQAITACIEEMHKSMQKLIDNDFNEQIRLLGNNWDSSMASTVCIRKLKDLQRDMNNIINQSQSFIDSKIREATAAIKKAETANTIKG